MRCATLIEEAAEHDQRGKLQDGRLPVGGETLQESTAGQISPIADRADAVRRQGIDLQPPACKALR